MSLSDDKNIRFSVITTTLGPAKFIEEAIASVLSQTHPEFEYLIFAHGQDGDKLTFDQRDRRIKLFQYKQRYSLGEIRNIAISRASYDWVCFIDDDDLMDPNWLLVLKKTIEKNLGFDFFYGDFWVHDLEKKENRFVAARQYNSVDKCPLDFLIDYPVSWVTCCFSRAAMEGNKFDLRFTKINDYAFVWDLVQEKRGAYVEAVGGTYRVHGDSLTRADVGKLRAEYLTFLQVKLGHLSAFDSAVFRGFALTRFFEMRRLISYGSKTSPGFVRNLSDAICVVLYSVWRII